MADPFLGEIKIFSFNFVPNGWAYCNGQLLPVAQHYTLYSLLGLNYGGDGFATFGLPDLRGRIPVDAGSSYELGAKFGAESVVLHPSQIPKHSHLLYAIDKKGDNYDPTNRALCKPTHSNTPQKIYDDYINTTPINSSTISSIGGKGHNNLQPSLVLNFCIALQGDYPPRS